MHNRQHADFLRRQSINEGVWIFCHDNFTRSSTSPFMSDQGEVAQVIRCTSNFIDDGLSRPWIVRRDVVTD